MLPSRLGVTRIKLISRGFHVSPRYFNKEVVGSKTNSEVEKVNPLEAYTPFGGLQKKENKDVFHYTDRESGKGYSHYSSNVYPHRPYIWPPLRKLYYWNYAFVIFGCLVILLDFDWVSKQFSSFKPHASQLKGSEASESETDSGIEQNEEKPKEKKKPKKKEIGFREKRIIEYENRLRLFSGPDKIFRYFATLEVLNPGNNSSKGTPYMTPDDFLRSITPGVMQPRAYLLDSYKQYNPMKHKKHKFTDKNSIFYKLASRADFALAFKIFDVNGDGTLDREEFSKVQELIKTQAAVTQRHRDHSVGSTTFKTGTNSALEQYFFGKDGTEALSAEKFINFHERLQCEILRMEFDRHDQKDGQDGVISEKSFAQLLLAHAQIPASKKKAMLKRVRQQFKGEASKGVDFEETKAFFEFLYHIDEVDTALHFHRMAGTPVDKKTLKKVAQKVTSIPLTDHVLDVVVTLFDDNLDGKLSYREMINVMRRRMRRGMQQPRDTGFIRFIETLFDCGVRSIADSF